MTDIGALYAIKNELGLDFSIKPREQIVDKMSDEMIKRQKTLDYLFSIKGTAFFSDNFSSVKELFNEVLQRIDDDPFYYDVDYFCEYSDYIIQIMEGTKLTEFIPVFLRKIEEAAEISIETSSIIFENVIELARTSNLMGEFLSQITVSESELSKPILSQREVLEEIKAIEKKILNNKIVKASDKKSEK